MAAAKQMEMQVIHGLTTVFAGIDDDAVAFAEAFVARNRGRCVEEVTENVAVLSAGVVERGEVFAGNDENVDGGLRMKIGEGVTQVVLVDGGGGDGAIGDFAKEAGHGVTSRRDQFTTAGLSAAHVQSYGWRSFCRSSLWTISGGMSNEGSCREQIWCAS
jgi:hypothetical protein